MCHFSWLTTFVTTSSYLWHTHTHLWWHHTNDNIDNYCYYYDFVNKEEIVATDASTTAKVTNVSSADPPQIKVNDDMVTWLLVEAAAATKEQVQENQVGNGQPHNFSFLHFLLSIRSRLLARSLIVKWLSTEMIFLFLISYWYVVIDWLIEWRFNVPLDTI